MTRFVSLRSDSLRSSGSFNCGGACAEHDGDRRQSVGRIMSAYQSDFLCSVAHLDPKIRPSGPALSVLTLGYVCNVFIIDNFPQSIRCLGDPITMQFRSAFAYHPRHLITTRASHLQPEPIIRTTRTSLTLPRKIPT